MKRKKVNYVISEEIKTNIEKPTKKDLETIFNKKYYDYIMRRERNVFNIDEEEKNSIKDKTNKS